MIPIDLRNLTFSDLQSRLDADRLAVHRAWLAHGPGTTREVAAAAGIDILSFRPRSTELYQLGALELVDKTIHTGVYRARKVDEWEKWFIANRVQLDGNQQKLL
jgi:hypothetical protein